MLKLLSHPVKKALTNFIPVLGISSLIVLPAVAQQLETNSVNSIQRVNTSNSVNFNNPIPPAQNGKVVEGRDTYPYGSRVQQNGTIATPQGKITPPNVTINRGDGSTSYYYPDGSRIDVNNNTIPPTGNPIK